MKIGDKLIIVLSAVACMLIIIAFFIFSTNEILLMSGLIFFGSLYSAIIEHAPEETVPLLVVLTFPLFFTIGGPSRLAIDAVFQHECKYHKNFFASWLISAGFLGLLASSVVIFVISAQT